MTARACQESSWVIRVDAATSRLADIRRFVEQVATEVAVDVERIFDLKVAVSEAFANAVEHARCGETSLEVSAQLQARRLTFIVTDNGTFRPPAATRESFGSRGLGLPLMVTLMDEVSFCREPDGGTSVRLSVQLDRA